MPASLAGPAPEVDIWEFAEEISLTIYEWPDQLLLVETVDELAQLSPNQDDEDDPD